MMRKKCVFLLGMIFSVALCGCNANIDANAIRDFSDSVNQFAESIQSMQSDVDMVNKAISDGVENANAVMEWYTEEAFKDIPNVDTPLDEEDVRNLVDAGKKEVNALIDEYVPEDAVYDVLSDADIDHFTDFFNTPEANGFLLCTYETAAACDLQTVFANGAGITKSKNGVVKLTEDDINNVLVKYLGIKNKDMTNPLKFSKSGDGAVAKITSDDKQSIKLFCNGGFYYNDIYAVMMCDANNEDNFSFTIFEKISDERVKIYMNYWSQDMGNVNWDGSMLYDLYDLMVASGLPAELSDIDVAGIVSNIPVDEIKDAIGEISAENIEDVAELVSSKIIDGKEINTYLQQFEGYEVYYKDVLNDALDEVEDFVVSQVIVTGGDYTTDEGISVGDSKKDVISAYGKGHEVRLTGGKRLIDYELGDKTIEFTINRDGDVEEICIYLSQR